MNKRFMYAIYLDGDIAPDTHIFCFQNLGSAILSLLLFCRTFLSKELRLYQVGYVENGVVVSQERTFICDFFSADSVLAAFLQGGNDSPITMEYLHDLKACVENDIISSFSSEEDFNTLPAVADSTELKND